MAVETDDYCRAIESYLCRKNDGHLIRIVGPAFERVQSWADQGVPLKAAYRGIDRYFERYYAKGARRRPVRVEFCEPDVLDVFDEWRRAVGVSVAREVRGDQGDTHGADEDGGRPHGSLKSHLERALLRLRAAGVEGDLADAVEEGVRMIEELAVRPPLRGDARREAIERLRAQDERLMAAARSRCDDATWQALVAEADSELAPFRARMPHDAYEQSRQACVSRLLRERHRLPVLAFE